MTSRERLGVGLLIAIFCFIIGILVTLLVINKPELFGSPNPNSSSSSSPPPGITVDAKRIWTDTDIKINKGDVITITATGQINLATPGEGADKWVGPAGGIYPSLYCNGQPCRYTYAVNANIGSLIGKIGNNRPFSVGSKATFTAPNSGTLYLGVNDSISDWTGKILSDADAESQIYFNNRGNFIARIQVDK